MQATVKWRFAGNLLKPSDGLEPSTPSLPWNVSGKRWQPAATVFACFRHFRADPICRCLPPVATTGLHKGSIRGSVQVSFDDACLRSRCGSVGYGSVDRRLLVVFGCAGKIAKK